MSKVNLVVDGQLTYVNNILAISAAKTLTAAQSGCVISLTSAGTNYIVTLPPTASSAGINYKFVLTVTAGTNTVQIATNAAETTMQGIIFGNATKVACVSKATITYGTTSLIGDAVDMVCDGTGWNVRAWSQIAGAFT
jgi:hypothetical protein